MGHRHHHSGHNGGAQRSRRRPPQRRTVPEYDREYDRNGLVPEERRRYRGPQSYEQQTRSSRGGRSGAFEPGYYPIDDGEREDERQRYRPDRYGRWPATGSHRYADEGDYDYDYRDLEDDYSRTDYGARRYSPDARYPSTPPAPSVAPQASPVSQRGRPPKGYTRSDERIREDVCDRLTEQWDVDASDMEVEVTRGEVTLRGTVVDRAQKYRAEDIADAVLGVYEIHNHLRIKH